MAATDAASRFADTLNEKFAGQAEFSVIAMRKYDRIVIERTPMCLPLAHAFVERVTGKLFKAAGWAGPAKNHSYDLSTPEGFAQAVELADIYGGYLSKSSPDCHC